LEEAVASGKPLNEAIQGVLGDIMKTHGDVIFNGDGYSQAWHEEAERRGLPNLKTTVDALPALKRPEAIALFERFSVLTPRELESRYEIYLEQYNKTVNVEATLVARIAKTTILPAALRYQTELATTIASVKEAGFSPSTSLLGEVVALTAKLE